MIFWPCAPLQQSGWIHDSWLPEFFGFIEHNHLIKSPFKGRGKQNLDSDWSKTLAKASWEQSENNAAQQRKDLSVCSCCKCQNADQTSFTAAEANLLSGSEGQRSSPGAFKRQLYSRRSLAVVTNEVTVKSSWLVVKSIENAVCWGLARWTSRISFHPYANIKRVDWLEPFLHFINTMGNEERQQETYSDKVLILSCDALSPPPPEQQ